MNEISLVEKGSKEQRIIFLMLIVGFLGAALSAYLWYMHATASDVACMTGCDAVMNSEYGELLGIPVGAWGLAFYVGVIGLTFQRAIINHKLLDIMLGSILVLGVIFTVWLRYVEFFIVNEICIWCWGSVVAVIAIVILFIGMLKVTKNKLSE